MEEGKCLTKDICVLRFNTFEAECYLNFGINTKFDFKYVSVNKVRLERKIWNLQYQRKVLLNYSRYVNSLHKILTEEGKTECLKEEPILN
ncbi:hypothetical protein [Clostridium botulinum]|uniref:Uncharacterized protein n=1 Tax=Clostridium botulinum TaxID=1491 RepID=A0A1L7JMP1_CLOBO|nr:hypothetical protein [Clostridium botulinum]APU87040.1 hypothetical protein NPD8_3941 [Clostridium botulinum]